MRVLLHPRLAHSRLGLTLVELMVAILVLSILAGISLPSVKSSLREQKVSRAASLLKSAIDEGRARAIASGGGGIIIDRSGTGSIEERCQSIRVRFAKVPPPFSGSFGQARAIYQYLADGRQIPVVDPASGNQLLNPRGPSRVESLMTDDALSDPTNPAQDYHLFLFDASQAQLLRSSADAVAGRTPTIVSPGDTLVVDEAGVPLRIERVVQLNIGNLPPWGSGGGGAFSWMRLNSSPLPQPTDYAGPLGYVVIEATSSESNLGLRRHAGRPVSFKILRAAEPAIAMPIDLPKGAVIDLTASGVGRFGNEFSPFQIAGNYLDESAFPFVAPTGADMASIWILFGERGSVNRVELTGTFGAVTEIPVTGDVHLLVGRGGQIKTAPTEQLEDEDSDPLLDAAKDGKTPLLDADSVWVTIKARTGEVLTSPWTDPTDGLSAWIGTNRRPAPTYTTPPTLAEQNSQASDVQAVIGRVRSAAVSTRDSGSI